MAALVADLNAYLGAGRDRFDPASAEACEGRGRLLALLAPDLPPELRPATLTLALGEMRGLLAVGIVWLSFYTKARREELFLTQEFGPSFAEHSKRTGMFLPRLS